MMTVLASLGVAHIVADGIAFVFLTRNIVKAGDTLLSNAKKMRKEDSPTEPKKKEKSFKDYRKY